jgi:HSP20 family molecular chaperone IbpA
MASAAPELARLQAKANAALPPLLRLDVHETDQDIVIRADVPGAIDEGIKIDVDKDNMLRASRPSPFRPFLHHLPH